jgi:hypothetical protein
MIGVLVQTRRQTNRVGKGDAESGSRQIHRRLGKPVREAAALGHAEPIQRDAVSHLGIELEQQRS